MQYYLVLWHERDQRFNGWDLVYTANKQEARKKYRTEHYSPIDHVAAKTDPVYGDMFEDIKPEEYEQARKGEVVNIETGT